MTTTRVNVVLSYRKQLFFKALYEFDIELNELIEFLMSSNIEYDDIEDITFYEIEQYIEEYSSNYVLYDYYWNNIKNAFPY